MQHSDILVPGSNFVPLIVCEGAIMVNAHAIEANAHVIEKMSTLLRQICMLLRQMCSLLMQMHAFNTLTHRLGALIKRMNCNNLVALDLTMMADDPSKSKADAIKQWREKKKEASRLKSKEYYQKHKNDISKARKEKRLDSAFQSKVSDEVDNEDSHGTAASFFPSRMAKKRAIETAKNALPGSPRRRTEVLTALLESPNTRKALSAAATVNTPEQEEEVKLARALLKDVSTVLEATKHRRSDGARATVSIGLSMLCGPSVAEGKMRKSLSEALNINRRRVAMSVTQNKNVFCDKDALWKLTKRKTRSDAISEEVKQIAQDFWSSPEISRPTGNKKDIKRERVGPKQYVFHEKQVLEKTQTEVYEEFKAKFPDIDLGQRAFEKCKPFYVIEARPQDRQSCCCRAHVEVRMLFKTCMTFRRNILQGREEADSESYPVFEHLSDLVNETLCNKGDNPYHRLTCINRECEHCGVTKLKLMSKEEDTSQSAIEVKWERFEYVSISNEGEEKRRLKIVTKTSKAGEMFAYFKTLLESFPAHQFRAKWQQEQMKRNVDSLPPGHVCCVHDYSENYCCRYQDQIQTLYFAQAQASIHVTILHRHKLVQEENGHKIIDSQETVTEHLFVISPDLKHDHDSVHECRSVVVDYLREIEYPLTVMHEWTDGCAAQYKSCHCMGDLSFSVADFGFLTVRNYFETSHAKGPQDGAGANLKHKVDMAVIRRQVVVQNAHDLYNYAKQKLTEPSSARYKSQSVGLERRIFFYVEQHRRNRQRRFKQIKGSRQIHSVAATGDLTGLKIKTRFLSCYCDSCIDDQFDCENGEWVEPWKEIELEQEGGQRRVTRSETVDQRVGIKDLITENSVVAIASGDPGEDYYLIKVTGQGPEELQTPTKDDWGILYPAGAEILCGHFLLPKRGSSRNYKMDSARKAIVYAATAAFVCTDLQCLRDETIVLSEQEHLDILQSLEGF